MPEANGSATSTLQTVVTPRPSPIRVDLRFKKPNEFWDSNHPHIVSLFSFLLGTVGASAIAFACCFDSTPQCWLYLAFLSVFHFLEYFITAIYKPDSVTLDAFLFNNGSRYIIAQLSGVIEFLVELYFFPHSKVLGRTTLSGLVLVIMGQIIRSLAMIHASTNFSHQIALEKKSSHQLVTTGVYAFTRHPSYFGFFWWGVGTQIFLANPINTIIFILVLWRFFSLRIQREEELLVRFFGEEYIDYRKKVGTWIPFIQ